MEFIYFITSDSISCISIISCHKIALQISSTTIRHKLFIKDIRFLDIILENKFHLLNIIRKFPHVINLLYCDNCINQSDTIPVIIVLSEKLKELAIYQNVSLNTLLIELPYAKNLVSLKLYGLYSNIKVKTLAIHEFNVLNSLTIKYCDNIFVLIEKLISLIELDCEDCIIVFNNLPKLRKLFLKGHVLIGFEFVGIYKHNILTYYEYNILIRTYRIDLFLEYQESHFDVMQFLELEDLTVSKYMKLDNIHMLSKLKRLNLRNNINEHQLKNISKQLIIFRDK